MLQVLVQQLLRARELVAERARMSGSRPSAWRSGLIGRLLATIVRAPADGPGRPSRKSPWSARRDGATAGRSRPAARPRNSSFAAVSEPVRADRQPGPIGGGEHHLADAGGCQRPMRCLHADEHSPTLSVLGATVTQIIDQRLADIDRQRQPLGSRPLPRTRALRHANRCPRAAARRPRRGASRAAPASTGSPDRDAQLTVRRQQLASSARTCRAPAHAAAPTAATPRSTAPRAPAAARSTPRRARTPTTSAALSP